jgi:hypothetical protein
VKFPGVKRPAMATAPVWAANFKTALWPYGRAEMTQMSAGLSTAAMIRAARTIFSLQVEISWVFGGDVRFRLRRDRGLPCLSNIDHVDAIRTGLPQIWLHVYLQVLGAEMALSSEQHLDILRSGVEACWKICRHDCGGY